MRQSRRFRESAAQHARLALWLVCAVPVGGAALALGLWQPALVVEVLAAAAILGLFLLSYHV